MKKKIKEKVDWIGMIGAMSLYKSEQIMEKWRGKKLWGKGDEDKKIKT